MKFVKIRTWNGSTTPPLPCYPLQMKLYLRYFRVVLFLLQRFKKMWIFRFSFFLWSLPSSIIQCKSVERNHVLHWVTTQPSELNELTLTVLTIGSTQAYQFSDFVSSPCRVAGPRLFRQIMTVQKYFSFPWTPSLNTTYFLNGSYILTYKSIRISYYFLFRYSLIFF